MSAYLESDSMMPEHRRPLAVTPLHRLLIERIEALEKKVKELEHRQSV